MAATRPTSSGPRGALASALVTALASLLTFAGAPPSHADYATTPTAQWYPGNGTVYAVAVTGSTVYLGGTFRSMRNASTGQSVPRSRLAAVDAVTGELLPWAPSVDDTVRALAVTGSGTVIAGGVFTSAEDRSASRLAAFAPDGTLVPGWSPRADNTVRDLLVLGDDLFVAGIFSTVDGVRRNGIARLDVGSGTVEPEFDARATGGKTRALATDGTRLYVGGAFTALHGQPHPFIGAVSPVTGEVADWAAPPACSDCPVLDLTTDGSSVYGAVGGLGGRAVAWSRDGGGIRWWRRGDGDVQSVAVWAGRAWFGGHFGPTFSGTTRHQLVVLDAGTGAITGFQLPFTGNDHPGLWALAVDDRALRVGGGFALSGTAVRRFATFEWN